MDLNESFKRALTKCFIIEGVHCLYRTFLNLPDLLVTNKNLNDQDDPADLGPIDPVGVSFVKDHQMIRWPSGS